MKKMNQVLFFTLVVFSSVNHANEAKSIEQAAKLMTELKININSTQQTLSIPLKKEGAKETGSGAIKAQELKSITVSGSGNSHKYVQGGFIQNKNQQSMVPENHLIDSITKNSQLKIPFSPSDDELVTVHWQQTNAVKVTTEYHSTWLINPDKGSQFTEKTAATTSIRPLVSADLLTAGNDFPVRLYHQYDALVEHEVYGLHIESHQLIKAWSDSHGIAVVNLSQAGDWVLMLKHVGQDPESKSESIALLNFKVKGAEK